MPGMVMLTHKLRMTVRSRRQREALCEALETSRLLYNAGLEERNGAWRKAKLRIGLHDQYKSLTVLSGDPSLHGLPVALLRWPLKRLDLAFRGFFRRVRRGQSPGFPRFRSISRWTTFGYSDRDGWKLVGRRLDLSRIGRFQLRLHRSLEGEVRSLAIKRVGRKWFALVTVEVANATAHAGPAVGVDLGLTRLATLSTGEVIANPREGRRRARAIAAARRALARAIRGSKRRRRVKDRLGRLKRRSSDHGSRKRERDNDLTPNSPCEAERAGGQVIRVNPKHTSNCCSVCQRLTPTKIGDEFSCAHCGHTSDRDWNAALNILARGVVTPGTMAA